MQNDRARTLPAAALLTVLFPGAPTGLPTELPTALAGEPPAAPTAAPPRSTETATRLPARSAGLPAPTTAAAPQTAETPYERRLAQYRSGDFVGAVRESRELPIRELRGAAESFLDRRPGGNPARDREFLAAALLHLDLAGPAETAAEENEQIARRLLDRVRGADRAPWTRDAHVGLLGFYMEYGRLEDALRMARFLGEEFRADTDARLARGHLAALIGWMFHDERFFDQARDTYETAILARESDAGAEPPTDLRLRLAHLVLRDGDAEGALAGLESAAAADFDARQRFLAHLLRGEALLWLDRAAEAEEAFAAAQAHHIGSISAAAGLAAVRQRLGDTAGAGEAARNYLSAGGDADTWWDFLLRGLTAERPRLATLRALVLQ